MTVIVNVAHLNMHRQSKKISETKTQDEITSQCILNILLQKPLMEIFSRNF